jgi:hypothetical protein
MNSAEYSHTASWFKLTTVSELNTIPMIIVLMWLIIQPAHNTHLHKNTACGCMQVSVVIRSSMKIAVHVDRKSNKYVNCMVGGGNWHIYSPAISRQMGFYRAEPGILWLIRLQQMTRIVQWDNNLQTPLSNPTGLCPTMSSSTTHVYNLGQLGVNAYKYTFFSHCPWQVYILVQWVTMQWNLATHYALNMNKSSSKCKPSYIIQPMSSILCGLLVNTSLQSCQSHIATTMSQYGHFPVIIS